MATIFHGSLHIWSLRKTLSQQGENHPDVHIYHERNGGNPIEDASKECKREWIESRGMFWTLANKRPEKLRDNLHDLEELMETFSVAAIKWKSTRHVQILLSNGALISITIGFDFGDIERISIDKSLVGKLTDQIHNAVIDELYMVFTFSEKSKIAFVYFGKRPTEKEGEKLSSLEPKIVLVDIQGPTGRVVDRRLSINCRGDLVCVWWPSSSEAAWPWSPHATDSGRTNLVLLAVSRKEECTQLDQLCHIHTDADPLNVAFSYNQPNQLYSVESSHATSGKYSLKSCVYECNQNKVHRVACVTVPVEGVVVAEGRNHREDKLLLACDDGTLVLYDEHRQLTQTTKTSFSTPSIIAWHPTDAIVLVASSRGEIQIFDMALACIPLQLSTEFVETSNYNKIGQFFLNASKLDRVSWACDFGLGPPPKVIGCYDDLLLVLDRGPLCVIRTDLGVLSNGRLGSVEIVSEYIHHKQELEAVNYLNGMNWNTNANLCFACLTVIMDYLFRLPFNLHREACIEDALGSFYAPSRMISDLVMVQFCVPVSRLARRFFHHLLRHKRFEKAFLLAVDIGAKDLFMDIHYLASDMGNVHLADAAKQRAMQIHVEETNPDIIVDGSDYSSDDSPQQLHDLRRQMNANQTAATYEPHTDHEKAAYSNEPGYQATHDKQRKNGRKHGMTKYSLPSNITDEVDYESSHHSGEKLDSNKPEIAKSRRKKQGETAQGSENNRDTKNAKVEIIHFGLV